MDVGANNRGVTLLELMIVLAIIGVVATVVTAYSSLSPDKAAMPAAAREIYSLLQDARNDAIAHGRNVIVVSEGKRVIRSVRDSNGNGGIDNTDLIRKEVTLPRLLIMSSNDFGPVMFNNRGYVVALDGQPTVIDIQLCEGSGADCVAGGFSAHLFTSVLGLPGWE